MKENHPTRMEIGAAQKMRLRLSIMSPSLDRGRLLVTGLAFLAGWLTSAEAAESNLLRGTVSSAQDSPLPNVLLYVETGAKESHLSEESPAATLDQRDYTFLPRVLPVRAGTTVRLENHDPELHNVHGTNGKPVFNLAMPPTDSTQHLRLDQPGTMTLLCDIHPQMKGYIVVLPNSLFSVTDAAGNFAIPTLSAFEGSGISPGTHTLCVWFEGQVLQRLSVVLPQPEPLKIALNVPPPSPSRDLSRTPESPPSWSDVMKRIEERLRNALLYAQKGDFGKAKQAVSDAYFVHFEAEGLETAIRQNLSARQAFVLEEMFSDLRFSVGGLTKGQATLVEAQTEKETLLQALWQAVEDLPAASAPVASPLKTPSSDPAPQRVPASAPLLASRPRDRQVLAELRREFDRACTLLAEGKRQEAATVVSDAYFEIFHRIEPELAAVLPAETRDLEQAFSKIRGSLVQGAPTAEVTSQTATLLGSLESAIEQSSRNLEKPWFTFLNAFVIILREGVEAILILACILVFVRRSRKPNLARLVYGGAGLALVASVLTALLVDEIFRRSGAAREALEGASLLLAAVVLFFVSYWFLAQAQALRWQGFIQGRIAASLGRGSAAALAATAFLAVYREGAETVLFYQALAASSPSPPGILVAGFFCGVVALVLIYGIFQKLTGKLPLRPFFTVSSAFLYALAFVFAGQGVLELAEAGWFQPTYLKVIPPIEVLGIYPTLETLLVQAVFVAAALISLPVLIRKVPQRRLEEVAA